MISKVTEQLQGFLILADNAPMVFQDIFRRRPAKLEFVFEIVMNDEDIYDLIKDILIWGYLLSDEEEVEDYLNSFSDPLSTAEEIVANFNSALLEYSFVSRKDFEHFLWNNLRGNLILDLKEEPNYTTYREAGENYFRQEFKCKIVHSHLHEIDYSLFNDFKHCRIDYV